MAKMWLSIYRVFDSHVFFFFAAENKFIEIIFTIWLLFKCYNPCGNYSVANQLQKNL